MIRGKIITEEYPDGSRLYRGTCVVRNETVSAGNVAANQIPDGPAPGFVRRTLRWVNVQDAGGSRCEFEITDERPAHAEVAEGTDAEGSGGRTERGTPDGVPVHRVGPIGSVVGEGVSQPIARHDGGGSVAAAHPGGTEETAEAAFDGVTPMTTNRAGYKPPTPETATP